ncbi:MAG: rod-binding protein [Lachnospiraceae bacterium]|nr:rod-binding protein [Lachnospiraceae bacterium]
MEIGSINAGFVNAVSDNAKAASNDITNKLKKDMSGADDTELMDVCKEFEAYFIEQVFKNMKKSMVPQSASQSGADATLKDFYEDKLMSEYAAGAAKQSENGLAQMLYEQMKRNRGTVDSGQI